MNTQTFVLMRLILLLLINWLSTIINPYSFSSDDRNQESIPTRSKPTMTLHSPLIPLTPVLSVPIHPTPLSLSSTSIPSSPFHSTAVPDSIPKKQRKPPFGLKLSVIE